MKKKLVPSRDETRLTIAGMLLRTARENLRYSYRELAELSGVSASQILRMESGEFDFSLTKFLCVSEALGLSVGMVLEDVMFHRLPREQLFKITDTPFAAIFRRRGMKNEEDYMDLALQARQFTMAVAEMVAALILSSNPRDLRFFINHEFSKVDERIVEFVEAMDIMGMKHYERLAMIKSLLHDPYAKLTSLKVIDDDLLVEFSNWGNSIAPYSKDWAYRMSWGALHVAKPESPVKTMLAKISGRSSNETETDNLDNYRTPAIVPDMNSEVPTWKQLKKSIAQLTTARGAKAALAVELGVSRQVLGNWLSDDDQGAPSAALTLRLLKWVNDPKRKPK